MKTLPDILLKRKKLIKIINQEVDCFINENCNVISEIVKKLHNYKINSENDILINFHKIDRKITNKHNKLLFNKVINKRKALKETKLINHEHKVDIVNKIDKKVIKYVFNKIKLNNNNRQILNDSITNNEEILRSSNTFRDDELKFCKTVSDKLDGMINLSSKLERTMRELNIKTLRAKNVESNNQKNIVIKLECISLTNKIVELKHKIDVLSDMWFYEKYKLEHLEKLSEKLKLKEAIQINKINLSKINILTERQIIEEREIIREIRRALISLKKIIDVNKKKILQIREKLKDDSELNIQKLNAYIIYNMHEKLNIK